MAAIYIGTKKQDSSSSKPSSSKKSSSSGSYSDPLSSIGGKDKTWSPDSGSSSNTSSSSNKSSPASANKTSTKKSTSSNNTNSSNNTSSNGNSAPEWLNTGGTATANNSVSNGSDEAIRQQMAKNSAMWYQADDAGKEALHQANVELSKKLGLTYNAASGTYGNSNTSNSFQAPQIPNINTVAQNIQPEPTIPRITPYTPTTYKSSMQLPTVPQPTPYQSTTQQQNPYASLVSNSNASANSGAVRYAGGSSTFNENPKGAMMSDNMIRPGGSTLEKMPTIVGDGSNYTRTPTSQADLDTMKNTYSPNNTNPYANLINNANNYSDMMYPGGSSNFDENTGTYKNTASTSNTATDATAKAAEQANVYLQYLKDAQAQAQAAQQAKTQAIINQLASQKTAVNQQTDDTLKQAYANNMIDQKNINQQLAAAGYTGGLSETSRLNLANNYENLRNNTQLANSQSLQKIDDAIANAQLSGNATEASLSSDFAQQLAAYYQSTQQQEQNQSNIDRNFNYQQQQDTYNRGIDARNFGYQTQQDLYKNQLNAYQLEQNQYNINRNFDYQQYQNDYQNQLNAYQLEQNQYNTNRNFNYQQQQDTYKQGIDTRNFNYQQQQDSQNYAFKLQQLQAQQQAQNVENARNYLQAGIYYEGLGAVLGIPEETAQTYANLVNSETQAKINATNRSNQSSGSSRSSGGLTASTALSMIKAGAVTQAAADALGMTLDEAWNIAGQYGFSRPNSQTPASSNGSTEANQRDQFLKLYGLVNGII